MKGVACSQCDEFYSAIDSGGGQPGAAAAAGGEGEK